jgi:hypothetical protein
MIDGADGPRLRSGLVLPQAAEAPAVCITRSTLPIRRKAVGGRKLPEPDHPGASGHCAVVASRLSLGGSVRGYLAPIPRVSPGVSDEFQSVTTTEGYPLRRKPRRRRLASPRRVLLLCRDPDLPGRSVETHRFLGERKVRPRLWGRHVRGLRSQLRRARQVHPQGLPLPGVEARPMKDDTGRRAVHRGIAPVGSCQEGPRTRQAEGASPSYS